jgi:hypothetical protein
LVPKKAKEFKKHVSEETGYPQELVNSFLDFYWEKIRKDVSDLVYPYILIPYLGTFKVKSWKLEEEIEHYQEILGKIEGNFDKYNMYKEISVKIEKLNKLKNSLEKEKNKLEEKKKLRNESIKNNMEQQIPDMGGIQEQDVQEQQGREDVQGETGDM